MWVLIFGVATGNAVYDALEHHRPFDWVWATAWAILTVLSFIRFMQADATEEDE